MRQRWAFRAGVLGVYGGADTKEGHHATIQVLTAAVVDLVGGKQEIGVSYDGHGGHGGSYSGS